MSYENTIALIGLAGRFPGNNEAPEDLWSSICAKKNCVSRFTDTELSKHGVSPSVLNRSGYVAAAPILKDFDHFDADLFGVTPREAELMDPQHRIMLECCWSALEHAGYNPRTLNNETGVFLGARTNTYLLNLLKSDELLDSIGSFSLGLGNDLGFLATRISHSLNLTGPSCSIQTACSTSLVCVHLACQSLLLGECSMALAGGVAINVPHVAGYQYQEGSVLSPDGYCRPFDAQARGTIFGSGAGVVVLKRLEEALTDGDYIHAVILGSAINNDGAQKASFTAPAVQGQVKVIREALINARIPPQSISYIEAHGTGTLLGDAIEVRALQQALEQDSEKPPIAIGSIKGNVGHLDAAAGITSLIKVVLSLKHRQLPPSLNFETANPRIDFERSGFYVNTGLRDWPNTGRPRRAGVSAFGVGGTNAHVILQEAPERIQSDQGRAWHLLVHSAKTENAEKEGIKQLAQALEEQPSHSVADIAYTLAVGRHHFGHRRAITCQSCGEGAERLRADESTLRNKGEADLSGVGFLFPWAETEEPEISKCLYVSEPVFRQEFERCAAIAREQCGFTLERTPYENGHGPSEQMCLDVALFALEYALAQLWISWGVEPKVMLGFGPGEYVAACMAGVMVLDDALHLLAVRDQLIKRTTQGAMAEFEAGEQELNLYLGKDVWLGAINGPSQCVVSGTTTAVHGLCDKWHRQGRKADLLKTSFPLQSPLMGSVAEEFVREVRKINLRPPQRAYISSISGATDRDFQNPEYWGEHLLRPVRIAAGLKSMLGRENFALLQVGPGESLTATARAGHPEARVFSSMGGADPQEALLRAVGGLWCSGIEISWKGFFDSQRRCRVPLPTYPFQRKRYWINPQPLVSTNKGTENTAGVSRSPGKLADVDQWFWSPSWQMANRVFETECADQHWIVLEDDLGISSEFTLLLRARGASVIAVRPADRFQRIGADAYSVDVSSRAGFSDFAAELSKRKFTPTRVCYAWGLTLPNESVDSQEFFKKFNPVGYQGLISLAIECFKNEWPCKFLVISNDCLRVEAQDRAIAAKAAPIAFCKILPQEDSRFAAIFVDVSPEGVKGHLNWFFESLLGEIKSRRESPVVAYRGKYRWIQSFRPRELVGTEPAFRTGGRYLITGGTGSIGLFLARHLARRFSAKIVLSGRSLPGRQNTEGGSHGSTISEYEALRQEIVSSGGDVLFCRADVADESEMMSVVSQSLETFGGLDGIVHAAGVTQGPSLFRLVKETQHEDGVLQASPKILGLYNIEKISRDLNLDFVLAMSSNASVLGGLGFLSYAAANVAMDVYMNRWEFDRLSTRWISANWDHWPEQTRKYSGVRTSMDEYAMTADEAAEAFERVCRFPDSGQIVVSTGYLPYRLDLWTGSQQDGRGRKNGSGSDQTNKNSRPPIRSVYAEPRNKEEATVAAVWAEVLGLDKVGIHDDFFELGGHSLMAVDLISRLTEATNMNVPLKSLFEGPTVAQLTSAVFGDLGTS